MCIFCAACFLLLLNIGISSESAISDEDYERLPTIYRIDDYDKCLRENKLYCKVTINLRPNNYSNPSHLWTVIERMEQNERYYDHKVLNHAICVDDFCRINSINRTHYNILSDCYQNRFRNIGVVAHVGKYDCNNYDRVHVPGFFDHLGLLIIISYVTLVIVATNFRRALFKKNYDAKALTIFSFRRNWRKLNTENTSPDFQKLKCIQGIRFYNMILIIFCHTYASFIGAFIQNTRYLEDVPDDPFKTVLHVLFLFLVQTFFLISSWLLSYHFFQIMEQNRRMNLRDLVITFINRYIRITPPLIAMLLVSNNRWILSFYQGPMKDQYADLEYNRCKRNWWATLLYINNHYDHHNMCYFITWYLSADTQLYLISLVVIGLMWKYRRLRWQIVGFFMAVAIIIPAIINGYFGMDVIYQITPEDSKRNVFPSFKFNVMYTSTYSNMATYMLGIVFGYLYYRYRNLDKFPHRKLFQCLWYILGVGLPIGVIAISCYKYSKVTTVVLSALLKPLFGLGIGVAILGMTKNIGGIIKKVCEWKPAVFMGNFAYSTYIGHFGIVFSRPALMRSPFYMTDFNLIASLIQDVVISFAVGFLLHLIVEMPASQLQNMIIPQVRSKRYVKKNA